MTTPSIAKASARLPMEATAPGVTGYCWLGAGAGLRTGGGVAPADGGPGGGGGARPWGGAGRVAAAALTAGVGTL